MSVLSMLYSFLFMPLQILFEVIYSYACRIVGGNYGLAIIALSLAINFLVLPLYRRADKIQEEERDTEAKLSKGVSHIKKTFHGDERTMMLQTYYRQNNYSPLHSLRSATSLFLEIPFFIAAYRFLSNLKVLEGAAFGPITDLGAQDALLKFGGISVNVLPLIMTVLNIISTVIFTKNSSRKTKVQLYAMALFFLVLLYNSPAGLVFYWTLNNLFSLVKTIFYKLKNPKKYLLILSSSIGIVLIISGIFLYIRHFSLKVLLFMLLSGIALCLPVIIELLQKQKPLPKISGKPNHKLFLSGTIFLSLLTGALIPSAIITASPQEFLSAGVYLHPIWYIVGTVLIAAGTFVLWFGVFYRLLSDNAKVVFERVIAILCVLAIVNYLFFGRDLGIMSINLLYDNIIVFTSVQKLINIIVLSCIAILICLLIKLKVQLVRGLIVASSIVIFLMSCVNTIGIFKSVSEVDADQLSKNPTSIISLSKNDKNVIVFMLDRAMGEYIPFIFNQYPELEEQYSGFTYYSNTISFGGHTKFGTPTLFGGYEYTPIEMNKRDKEFMFEKHNEALKVMPVLFYQNGFDVTVCDPPYAGYQEIPNLSIYDEYSNMKAFLTRSMFVDDGLKAEIVSGRQRVFFCHSIFKVSPVFLQSTLYNNGGYNIQSDILTISPEYKILKNLVNMTSISNKDSGSFFMINNNTTHSLEVFPELDYIDASTEKNNSMLGTSLYVDGNSLIFDEYYKINSYQNNVGALKKIGEWLDYLKSQGVYDNTRIIFVSDHGDSMMQMENFFFDETVNNDDFHDRYGDLECYYPLLMVKDFDSHEFTTSDEFMTNADVPTLATMDIITNPINPFTKKKICNDEKYAHDQYIIATNDWLISKSEITFIPSRWYSVHDSIWDLNNWKLVAENAILP